VQARTESVEAVAAVDAVEAGAEGRS